MEKTFYREYFHFEEKHWWFRGREKIVTAVLRKYLLDTITPQILDAGTGTGRMLQVLGQYGETTGLDKSKDAIGFCRERGIENVIEADAESIPFKSCSFDLLSAMDLLEHLDNDVAALKEFHRVLRKDGLLLLTVPAFMFLWSAHDVINHHRRRYTKKYLVNAVRTAGFKIEKASYFNSLLFPIVLLQRLVKRVRKSEVVKSDLKEYPPFVNAVLEKVFVLEKFLLRHCDLPVGVSILCIARRA